MRLLGLIDKHEVSNTILLSGDVHYANAFATPCSAVAGYDLVEYTSSGMSHTAFWPFVDLINLATDPLYAGSSLILDKNFGSMKINPSENKVSMQIVTIDGATHFDQEFDLTSDFVHDKANLERNREFCIHAQSRSKLLLNLLI